MNLFRAVWQSFITKTSAVAPLVLQNFQGRPIWTPRRYDELTYEGYQKNIIAYACVNEVAGGAANAPWQLKRKARGGGKPVVVEEHPLMALLARPNPWMGFSNWVERFLAFYKISGNVYVEAVGPGNEMVDEPKELYIQRPDRMKVIGGTVGIKGYEYKVGGRTKKFEADEITGDSAIMHWKSFHPLDDFYGMSPIEAAAFDIDVHNQSMSWNKALLDNSARPAGTLTYEPPTGMTATLSDPQRVQLKREIQEAYTGARNAGRPMLLEGYLKWQDMSFSPKDMEWLNSKNTTARDICYAFGIPPFILGIPGDNTYSNQREARLALWEQTIIPDTRRGLAELNNWLVPRYGDDRLFLDINLDEVSALGPRRDRIWDRAAKATWLTDNEKREMTGYPPVIGGEELPSVRTERMAVTAANARTRANDPPGSGATTRAAEILGLEGKEFEEWLVEEGYDEVTAKAMRKRLEEDEEERLAS